MGMFEMVKNFCISSRAAVVPASGGRDGRDGLEAQYVGRARFAVGVEQAVHKAHEGAGGMGIVDGRAEDESVGLLGKRAKLVDGIVEDASAGFAATPARHAAGGGLGADPEDLTFDSMRIKRRGDFGKRAVSAAVLVRASVDEYDFHGASSSLLRMYMRPLSAFSSV